MDKFLAHVGYVLPDRVIAEKAGADINFLLSIFKEPLNIILIAGTIILVAAVSLFVPKISFVKRAVAVIKQKAGSYGEFIPWILRLSLGISLIGSGVAGNLISPGLSDFSVLSFLQIILGFFLIAGFLLTPAALLAIFLYFIALVSNFYILGNLEFLAGAAALLILSDAKPGIDHLFGVPTLLDLKHLKKWVPLILRIGIGGAMIFLALYEKLLNPHLSEIVAVSYKLISVIPVSPAMWVFSAGVIELIIGLLLLIGFRVRTMSAVAFLVLSLSFFYFGEDVYSHITLFGVLSILFITGAGKWGLDKK